MRHNTLYLLLTTTMFLAANCLTAQQNNFNKELELRKFIERGGKILETSPNIYKLTYSTGESRSFFLISKLDIDSFDEPVDTTIINVWEIDTTLYTNKFTFWQKVQVANSWWAPLPVEDLNKNERPELYGYTDFPDIPYPPGGPVQIFERDIDGIFKSVFIYDSSTIFVGALGDIHGTGGKEIYIHSKLVNNGVVYRSNSVGELPKVFDFLFYYNANQVNNMTFGDFDNNNITDCAFIDGAGAQHCIIGEYRDSINNFEQLYQFSTTNEGDFSGFAINDFDQDGKTELVLGSGRHGNVYVIENIANNEYSMINQFIFPFPNAYMITFTDDIDKNGRTEFWIGGQDFEEGVSTFQCYESNGNNSYKVVARIELRYLVSFYTNYIQSSDIDNDGIEELIISIANTVLVLNFAGKINEHRYELFYAKLGEATQPGAEFYPVAISDLDGDNKKDILLPFRKYQYPITYAFSYILTQEPPTDVNDFQKPKIEYELIQNYPNPFNPSTKIKYNLPSVETHRDASLQVTLIVYDVLGNEVATLVNEEKPSGSYEVKFDGSGLPSGIYFYQLRVGDPETSSGQGFVETKKMILMK